MQENNNTELPHDIISLPSNGKFYKNGCNKVKVYYLTATDESILTSQNLINSGNVIPYLLDKKVAAVDETTPFVTPSEMINGDRLAILIWLRISLNHLYKFKILNEINGKEELVEFDLTTLKVKKTTQTPDNENYFDFKLPVSKDIVHFKLLTGEDDKIIKNNLRHFNTEEAYVLERLSRIVVKIHTNKTNEVITDPITIRELLTRMRLGDSRALNAYMNKIEPSFDLNVEVETTTGIQKTALNFGGDFFFPSDS